MRKVLLGVAFLLALMGLVMVDAASGDILPEVSFGSDSLHVAEDAGHIDMISTSASIRPPPLR